MESKNFFNDSITQEDLDQLKSLARAKTLEDKEARMEITKQIRQRFKTKVTVKQSEKMFALMKERLETMTLEEYRYKLSDIEKEIAIQAGIIVGDNKQLENKKEI